MCCYTGSRWVLYDFNKQSKNLGFNMVFINFEGRNIIFRLVQILYHFSLRFWLIVDSALLICPLDCQAFHLDHVFLVYLRFVVYLAFLGYLVLGYRVYLTYPAYLVHSVYPVYRVYQAYPVYLVYRVYQAYLVYPVYVGHSFYPAYLVRLF